MATTKMARTSTATAKKPQTSPTSTVQTAFLFRPALVPADALPVPVAAEIAVPVAAVVAADAVVAAVVVLDRAAVAATRAATLVAEHRRAAAIGSRSQRNNRVRVALRRGPFACAAMPW